MSGLSERLLDYANRFEDNAGVPSDALEADIREAASLIDQQEKALEWQGSVTKALLEAQARYVRTIDQQEKALEAADGLSEAVSKFSILWGMFDPEISRAAYANDFYRSARPTSTKEDG